MQFEELGDEAERRKKLKMRKKDISKHKRKLEGVKSMVEASKKVLKEKELAQIEQTRNDLLPEHENMQNMSPKLQSLEDRLAQSRDIQASFPK